MLRIPCWFFETFRRYARLCSVRRTILPAFLLLAACAARAQFQYMDLHDFGGTLANGKPDGGYPYPGASFDAAGNIYGVTLAFTAPVGAQPSTITGGGSTTATITLFDAAPAGSTVTATLAGANPIPITGNGLTYSFTVNAKPRPAPAAPVPVSIQIQGLGYSRSVTLTINPTS